MILPVLILCLSFRKCQLNVWRFPVRTSWIPFFNMFISLLIFFLYLKKDLIASENFEGRWNSGNSPNRRSFASLYESSLSFFFPVLNMSDIIEGSARRMENPTSLNFPTTYFPDVDTSSAISGFFNRYLSLNSDHLLSDWWLFKKGDNSTVFYSPLFHCNMRRRRAANLYGDLHGSSQWSAASPTLSYDLMSTWSKELFSWHLRIVNLNANLLFTVHLNGKYNSRRCWNKKSGSFFPYFRSAVSRTKDQDRIRRIHWKVIA